MSDADNFQAVALNHYLRLEGVALLFVVLQKLYRVHLISLFFQAAAKEGGLNKIRNYPLCGLAV